MRWLLGLMLGALLSSGASEGQGTQPQQIHLAWGDDPQTSVSVVWQTERPTSSSVVEYGSTPRLGQRALGREVRYAYSPSVFHEVLLRGLQPGTRYFYRVGDPQGGWSEVFSFRTAPSGVEDFLFTAYGDQGVNERARRLLAMVAKEEPAFHLHLGDLSYANGRQHVWDDWFRLIEPLAARVPYMPTLGNHENERIGEERIGYLAYLTRFALPQEERYYSFEYAGVRFIAFNSDDYQDPLQFAWLQRTLKEAQRQRNRWVILFQHHPLFGSVERRGYNRGLIQRLAPLLEESRVDLVLAGHDHVYERTFPLRGAEPATLERHRYRKGQGTIHITSGGGGISLYRFIPESPPTTAFREAVYHYLRIRVPAQGPLRVEAIRMEDGQVLDWLEIAP